MQGLGAPATQLPPRCSRGRRDGRRSGHRGLRACAVVRCLHARRGSEGAIQTMHRALIDAMQTTDVKSRFFAIGAEVVGSSPEEFVATIAAENAKWSRIVRERNIHAD